MAIRKAKIKQSEYRSIFFQLAGLMPRGLALMAFAHDVLVAVLAWFLAYLLRFNLFIPHEFIVSAWQTLLWVLPLQAIAFIFFGLYRGVWRFASISDLQRILMAVSVAALAVTAVLIMFKPHGIVPRSVLILDPILLVLMMGGSRVAYRAWKERSLYGLTQTRGAPVLVLGAGEAAVALLKDLARSQEWQVIGLLDDDVSMHGRQIYATQVLGSIAQLPDFVTALGVRHVIVAMPSAAHQLRRQAVDIANRAGLTVLTVPAFDDLMSGKISISQIRRVEVEDLLGREPVRLDGEGLHALLSDRVVMVTGAGGSIGAELCRQIAKYEPAMLLCLELSEFALYQLEQEFALTSPQTKLVYAVGDVKNDGRLKALLQRYRPAIVFHAAAYKHVPLMEHENVAEALFNNVLGTHTLAKCCKEAGVEKFILISTDKAVNPTNIMGASKRLAEMVCQGLQEGSGTRFVIVRFGNVLASSGSVIPKFRQQIAQGGPVTVTHPDITRYFMSIPEAAQLVMQGGVMGEGGEIFVLDMGEPVRIADLAKDMIRLSGLQDDEIEIIYTGLRPGEKLYEELLADDEHTLPTPHAKLRIALARQTDKTWLRALLKWIVATSTMDEADIKDELKLWVEEYVSDTDRGRASGNPALTPASSTIH